MEPPVAESGRLAQHPGKIVPNQAAEIGESDEAPGIGVGEIMVGQPGRRIAQPCPLPVA